MEPATGSSQDKMNNKIKIHTILPNGAKVEYDVILKFRVIWFTR